ncbi:MULTISPECIES: hypothetical protein [Asaia]|uniref:Uncharacterized protein n=1 Tax=Asaia bogorensis TaxID=91915 RepID=A0A060QIM3_9PROT|nr:MULTISPECIES: hypothetical protein [Asaia]CDG41024.1 hypothetical protein ASAP_2979 [Asaia bogorensis]
MTSAPVRTLIPASVGEMINGLVFFAHYCVPNASLAPPVETSDYLNPDGTVDLEIKTQISPGGSYHFVPVETGQTLVLARGAIGAMIRETYSDPDAQAQSVLLAYARAGGDDRCHPLQLPPRTLPKP